MEILQTRTWKSTGIKAVLVFILVSFLILNGCTGLGIIPTPIDRTPSSPTSTRCPNIYLATPSSLENAPVFLAFLIQEDSQGRGWHFSKDSFDTMYRVLPVITEPGDRLVVFRLGPPKFDDALVFIGKVGDVSHPSIPSTLTPWPTVTSTIPPTTPTPKEPIYQTATAAVASKTQSVIDVTATAVTILNICGEQVWGSDFAVMATQWEVTRQAAKNVFGTKTSNINPNNGVNGIQNQVYEGLDHATRAFKAECNNGIYRRCMLIIFSDLTEWRPSAPQFDVPIDLKGIDVMSVLFNCPVLFSPDCSAVQNNWSKIFKSFGANSSTFISGEEVEKKLIDFIRR